MTDTLNPTRDDFAALLDEQLTGRDFNEGQVVHGLVVGVEKDFVIVDVGLKTEGRISVREFTGGDASTAPKVGDTVEVYLERVENAMGEAVISRDKAKREEAWNRLEGVFASEEPVMGTIVGRVKGGFTVDLGGASAFLPGSQVDIRPVRDVGPLMGKEQPFQILKMDRPRGNIVVSRRAILEEARAEQRTELVSHAGHPSLDLLGVRDVDSHPNRLAATGDERTSYNVAFDSLKAGKYDDSAQLFLSFLQLYPNGVYAPNALYWSTKNFRCA